MSYARRIGVVTLEAHGVEASHGDEASAPFSNSRLTTAVWPLDAAKCSAVHPLLLTETSAPCSNNNRTTASCPLSAARCRAVLASLDLVFTFIVFDVNSRLVTATWPPLAALCSAVSP